MLLTLDNQSGALRVRRYTDTELWVEDQRVDGPCILSPHKLILGWQVDSVETLTRTQLQPLLDLAPRILLLGVTGPVSRPPAALRRDVEALGVAMECMSLGAACRTFNVLGQEGREVVAGLIPAR